MGEAIIRGYWPTTRSRLQRSWRVILDRLASQSLSHDTKSGQRSGDA